MITRPEINANLAALSNPKALIPMCLSFVCVAGSVHGAQQPLDFSSLSAEGCGLDVSAAARGACPGSPQKRPCSNEAQKSTSRIKGSMTYIMSWQRCCSLHATCTCLCHATPHAGDRKGLRVLSGQVLALGIFG